MGKVRSGRKGRTVIRKPMIGWMRRTELVEVVLSTKTKKT